jgi:excisionase family DNA binding protein
MSTKAQELSNGQRKQNTGIRLYSLKTGSAFLGISFWGLRALIERGEIPIVRMGRRVLVDIEDLNSWISQHKEQL